MSGYRQQKIRSDIRADVHAGGVGEAKTEKEMLYSAGHDAYSAQNHTYSASSQKDNRSATDAHPFMTGQSCNGSSAHAYTNAEKKEILVGYQVRFCRRDAACGDSGVGGLSEAEREREAALKRFYAAKIRQLQVSLCFVCVCVCVYVCVCVCVCVCVWGWKNERWL
jgi:hypothetical protein